MSYRDKQTQLDYQKRWRAKRRVDAIAARGGKCVACDSREKLEFHHVYRSEKVDHRVYTWSKRRMDEELAKCDLLCSKCHFEETAIERGYYIYQHGTLTSYKRAGCRCDDCKKANANYESSRRSHQVRPV